MFQEQFFSAVSSVSGFVDITLSPAASFSIATRPATVKISILAIKRYKIIQEFDHHKTN